MRIIFMGPDKVGKDTMIEKVLQMPEYKDYKVLHDKGPGREATFEDAEKYIANKWDEMLSNNNTIYNRCFLEEYVWGALFRSYSPTPILERYITALNVYKEEYKIIIMIEHYSILIKREDGHSLPQTEQEIVNVCRRFVDLRNFLRCHGVKSELVYVNSRDVDTVFNEIKEILNGKH